MGNGIGGSIKWTPTSEEYRRIPGLNDNPNFVVTGGVEKFGSGYVFYPPFFRPIWMMNTKPNLSIGMRFSDELEPAKYFHTDYGSMFQQDGTIFKNEKVEVIGYIGGAKNNSFSSPNIQWSGVNILFPLGDKKGFSFGFGETQSMVPRNNSGSIWTTPTANFGFKWR